MNENFSPLLLAGILMQSLPRAPLDRLLHQVARRIQNNHPAILDRLRPLAGTDFLICPTDMPYAIRMIIGELQIDCSIEDEFQAPADVRISGPLLSLMDMMDGKVDGDALFFSRSLTVEGNTEALLTLRNAMDSDDIDIRDELVQSLGLLKNPAQILLKVGGHLFGRISKDMNMISQAMTEPIIRRCDALEKNNQALHHKITHLEKMLTKTQNKLQSLSRKPAPGNIL